MKSDILEIPLWWPEHPPIYDTERSYQDNFNEGPFFNGKFLERKWAPKEKWIDFLGFRVASPLGVPAGPLLNSNWTGFAAKVGFDIVTYKTIRSKPKAAHPLPNMLYVDTRGPLTRDRYSEVVSVAKNPPRNLQELAATNSFGIPSQDRDFLLKDIARANDLMAEGQVLIVSIVGTPREGEDFVQDFALASRLAKEGGAKIIEADFSCPNVASCEGSIHTDPPSVYKISKAIREEIGATPLVIKLGVIEEKERLEQVMIAAARAGVDAVCGINTVSMKVIDHEGKPALGPTRATAGVCGGPIRHAALEFVEMAYDINNKQKLGLTIMATGGATEAHHFDMFLNAGADVAMSAIGMMWDPYLAARYHAGK